MKFQQFMDRSQLMKFHLQYQMIMAPLIQSLKREGLNFQEALCLLALFFEGGGEITPSDLSKTLLISKDQISHALTKLENADLIHRQLAEKDKRKRVLSITMKGKKISSLLVRVFDEHEEKSENI